MKRKIEYVDITKLKPAKRNPKEHDVGTLSQSIGRFGYVSPIVVDGRTGRVVAGHGRIETLIKLKQAKEKAPDGVVEEKGTWKVPVVSGWASKNDKEAEAFLIADNKLSELGGWNDTQLEEILKELADADALDGIGFDGDDVDKLVEGMIADEDAVPEANDPGSVKVGHVYELGDHRLVCGDSASKEVVELALGKNKARLYMTDPPYGIDHVATKQGIPRSGFKNIKEHYGDIANDGLRDEALQSFLESVFKTASGFLENAAWYLWHAHLTAGFFSAAAAAAADVLLHRQIIWKKPGFVLTRSGMYHSAHEPCFYGWVKGKQPPWYGEKNQTSVWEVGRDGGAIHPTQKPVELFRIAMRNHLKPGEWCLESFSGSGSQIIAAESLGVRCAAIELEPKYVNATIKRWEVATGKKAKRVKFD